jgi:hypothetical protein
VDGTDDYPELHAEMEKIGFVRTIKDTGGPGIAGTNEVYKLPGGLYFFDKKEAVNTFRNYASAAEAYNAIAKAVGKVVADDKIYVQDVNDPPSVLVTNADDITWSGFKKKPTLKLKPRVLKPKNPFE